MFKLITVFFVSSLLLFAGQASATVYSERASICYNKLTVSFKAKNVKAKSVTRGGKKMSLSYDSRQQLYIARTTAKGLRSGSRITVRIQVVHRNGRNFSYIVPLVVYSNPSSCA